MATAMTVLPQTPPDLNQLYNQAVPDIINCARFNFRAWPASAREEGIAEAIAAAFVMADSLHRRGRAHVIGRPGFVRHAVDHVLGDRHVGGSMRVGDVFSRRAHVRHGFRIRSLAVANQEGGWEDLAVEDRRTGPAEIAALRIDFSAWLNRLSRRDRRIVGLLASGERAMDVARTFRISSARISQLRAGWRKQWTGYLGLAAA